MIFSISPSDNLYRQNTYLQSYKTNPNTLVTFAGKKGIQNDEYVKLTSKGDLLMVTLDKLQEIANKREALLNSNLPIVPSYKKLEYLSHKDRITEHNTMLPSLYYYLGIPYTGLVVSENEKIKSFTYLENGLEVCDFFLRNDKNNIITKYIDYKKKEADVFSINGDKIVHIQAYKTFGHNWKVDLYEADNKKNKGAITIYFIDKVQGKEEKALAAAVKKHFKDVINIEDIFAAENLEFHYE